MIHGAYTLTVDVAALGDGIQTLLTTAFQFTSIALMILAPIAAIGVGWKFARNITAFIVRAIDNAVR